MDADHPVNDLLMRLDPSGSALLDWLRPQIDDINLWRMAGNGTPDEENYFHALKRIQQGEPIPIPLRWVPLEILNFNRWSEPGGYKYGDSPSDMQRTRGHLERAFCCTVLLMAADESETRGNIFGENEAMIQLLASVLYLGKEASESALRLLCWRVLRMSEWDEDFPFFAMAILLLYAFLYAPDANSADLILVANWVIAAEAKARAAQEEWTEEWLLGLTNYDQRHKVWRRVAQEVLLDPAKAFPEPAASALRDIAQRLSE